MNRLLTLIVAFLALSLQYAVAQDAMTQLRDRYAEDAAMLSKIDRFVQGGYERSLETGDHSAEDFITAAQVYLGTSYRYGGTTAKGMDCSGLIYRTFTDLGLRAPHGAQALARFGEIILDKEALRPGDVIFFTATYSTDKLVTHAAFVMADGQMIHASTSKGVQVIPLDDLYYWNAHYLFGTRIFAK